MKYKPKHLQLFEQYLPNITEGKIEIRPSIIRISDNEVGLESNPVCGGRDKTVEEEFEELIRQYETKK